MLGTPAQVTAFCQSWPQQPCLRFVFDIDKTLCTEPRVTGDYSTCEPIERNIAYVKGLHAQGHYILLATARRMRTHASKVGAAVADIGMVTMQKLKDWEVPYDEICFGKPWGQFYIDDLGTVGRAATVPPQPHHGLIFPIPDTTHVYFCMHT